MFRFGTKRVHANRVYQEVIQDKHHMHMNATRWVTLSEFVKHLGRSGIARVDETDKGWFIAWIDRSPKALEKQEASMKKERAVVSDEQRERTHIAEQIERAERERAEKGEVADEAPAVEEGLKKGEGEKLVLSFGMKRSPPADPPSPPSDSSSSTPGPETPPSTTPAPSQTQTKGIKLNALKPAAANPLKRPNVFKMAAAAKTERKEKEAFPEQVAGKKREAPMSAAERLIFEDQERKRRRMERDAERLSG